MKNVLNTVSSFLSKNFAAASVVTACVALAFPAPWVKLGKVAVDLSAVPVLAQHFAKLGMVNILLAVIMLGMGMTLKTEDFLLILKRPRDVVIGIFSQYVYMAGLGFLVAKLFQMSGVGGPQVAAEVAVGLVLLGCVPGGTTSNIVTFLAHGDVALSVTMTMCTTLLAPVLTPTLTYVLAGQWIQVDFLNMFLSIVLVVFLPIVLGVLLHAAVGKKVESWKSGLVFVSTVCVLMVLAMCVGPNRAAFFNNGLSLVLMTSFCVLLHHVLGLLAGYLTAKAFHMSEDKVRALSVEVGLQNSGLACTLANTAFAGTLAILPNVLATIIHQVVGPMVAGYYIAKDEKAARGETYANAFGMNAEAVPVESAAN